MDQADQVDHHQPMEVHQPTVDHHQVDQVDHHQPMEVHQPTVDHHQADHPAVGPAETNIWVMITTDVVAKAKSSASSSSCIIDPSLTTPLNFCDHLKFIIDIYKGV